MQFNVVKWEKIWWSISAVLCILSVVAMVVSYTTIGTPLRPSIDFVGGTRLQLELDCSVEGNCDRPLTTNQVREVLEGQNLANSSVQIVGDEQRSLSIRTQTLDVEARTRLAEALTQEIGAFNPESQQIDTVGPSIGQELFTSGILALLVSFFGIVVYLSIRFKTDYAVFAVIALLHDALIALGFFAVLGLTIGVEVDTLFLVAILTIIGFSVNDTVVIYDRIREISKDEHIDAETMNETIVIAVNQTLTRSINTSLTTVLPLVAIFLFGGETLKYFALALIVGFLAGSYSSIFVASTLLGWWRKTINKNKSVAVS
ncbi:protein translocase subunit SecF [Cyanobacterium sp. IPPAS B-1200]|uniref:protein translocase subunit SecF n=1 Tax=Cyanobacterium sp. IPPAS B-1200 TaxID=1562720 RepID=UPI0008528666|nr:preprotein translocase subunit SecF [Cyanobacterium sp. IPPAS B-1200]